MSVDTVRFYQSKGLLPQPDREGRVAWYSDEHVERLDRIKGLKDKGFTLSSISRLLSGDLDQADEALVEAVTVNAGVAGSDDAESFTLNELAARTGVSPALLQAIEREGLLSGRERDGVKVYSSSDGKVVEAGLALLETGLPLGELLALAREHDAASRAVARSAVEMFLRFVRDPIRASATSESDAAERVIEAFNKMLPATTALVANHFQAVLLAEAQARIERDSDEVVS
jgi:DNA-binding transcriptional MerR regulator